MKLLYLVIGDIRFQIKYGFYFLYAVFSVLYIIILVLLPQNTIKTATALLIFTDPSVFGLIFMGSIVQFEITEKTFDSLCIAPIRPVDYLFGKLISLSLLSWIVGMLVGLIAGDIPNLFWFSVAIIAGSMIFSAVGMIFAFRTHTLNKFFLSIVPIMIFGMIPGVLHLFDILPWWMIFHPGVAIVEMLISGSQAFVAIIITLLWMVLAFWVALSTVRNRFGREEGDNR